MEIDDVQFGGSGYGDGYGYGYGYGYGDGYGDGSGSGYGYGYGDGSGYGYGSGYGDGDEKQIYFAALLTRYQRDPNTTIVFWRSRMDGTPANGGSGTKAVVGKIEEIKGPLKICTDCGLHGTTDPLKWKGERLWIVELHHPIQQQDDKVASLKRTILADLGKFPFQ